PLLCYLKSPILIKNQAEILITDIPTHKIATNRAIFLINTGKSGKTEPLVRQFIKHCENPDFNALVHDVLIPLNNQCIQSLLDGRYRMFYANLHLLSDFQYHHFKSMIPEDFRPLWKEGLDHHKFKLKLCGSGGGGFLLGFSPNYQAAHDALAESKVDFITVYKKP
ncbi:MAG: mevalonate kinase, partial [Bacteroidota bacterium]|nr:mevalonate kinase [Bacteroidota bacterium]